MEASPTVLRPAVIAAAFLSLLSACKKPDLRITEVQATLNEAGEEIHFDGTVENRRYTGNLLTRPGPAEDSCYVHAWLSSDGESLDKPVSMHFRFLFDGDSLPPGATRTFSGWTSPNFAPFLVQYPYLVIVVDSLDEESEWNEANNTRGVPTPEPTP